MSASSRRVDENIVDLPWNELFAAFGEDSDASLDEIRQIVEHFPHSVKTATTDGGYALHKAVRKRPNDLKLIKFLVEQHPQALRETDEDGCLPLHAAMQEAAGIDTIRYLVETSPSALYERCSQWGYLPVHYALRSDPHAYGSRHRRATVIRYVVEKWPKSLEECTRDGMPPLHLLFARDDKDDPDPLSTAPDPDLVRFLLQKWPPSVRKTDGNGRTVLHMAAKNANTPREVIRLIVKAWPHSVRSRETTTGYLPVHLAAAASSDVPWGVTEYLLRRWPPSVQEKTETGKIVLHYVLLHLRSQGDGAHDNDDDDDENNVGDSDDDEESEHNSDDDDDDDEDDEPDAVSVVRRLVRRWPQSVREETNEGFVALHLAARIHMPTSVIRYLVRQWHGAVRTTSRKGWLPLHRAAKNGASLSAIRFLVRQYPRSVRQTTNRGLLPLHLALSNEASLEVIEFLVQQRTESLQERTRDGDIALHVAANRLHNWRSDRRYWLNVTRFLMEQYPPSVHVTSPAGKLPVHLAAASQAWWEVVRRLVEQAPASAMSPDADGSLPLHLAAFRDVPSAKLVQYLAEYSPLSVRTPDRRGLLPLHKALSQRTPAHQSYWKSQLPVVKVLVDALPASLLVQDSEGRIPLLVAAESEASLDVLFFLLTKIPLSIRGRRASRTKRPRLH